MLYSGPLSIFLPVQLSSVHDKIYTHRVFLLASQALDGAYHRSI